MTYFERSGILVPASVRRQELVDAVPGFVESMQRMRADDQVSEVQLRTWELYLMFMSLQLTVSHPRLGDLLRVDMEAFGRVVQGWLAELYPELADIMESGWQRDLDVTEDRGAAPADPR